MEYMGDKNYWDDKFSKRTGGLLDPEESLVANISELKSGTILDIACGDGRNALFLLEKGFHVTGVDFSNKALERYRILSEEYHNFVNTIQIDLSTPNSLKEIGVFDNIIINHYRMQKQQIKDIEKHIVDDGILFICGFGHKHKADSRIREEDLIQPSDFEDLHKVFQLVKYIENQDDRGFFVTYIFRKRLISNHY